MQITYKYNSSTPFYSNLREQIEAYFAERTLSPKANRAGKAKTFVLIGLFFVFYFAILNSNNNTQLALLWVMCFGIISSLIGLNISHDAVHGNIFDSRWANKLFSFSFNLIGANEYVWRITHNDIHHRFPNVPAIDPDIDQSPLIRMSPAVPLRWYHRYQHIYGPFVYLFFGFYMVYIKDFRIMFFLNLMGEKPGRGHPVKEIVVLFASKLAYVGYMVILPLMIYSWSQVLIGNLIVLLIIAIIFTAITAPAHVAEENDYLEIDQKGILYTDWASYQLRTTVDFNINSGWSNFLMGGGNFQTIHHLFPKIHHVHLKPLSNITSEYAQAYGIEYKTTSLWQALVSHFKLLKHFGQEQSPEVVKQKLESEPSALSDLIHHKP